MKNYKLILIGILVLGAVIWMTSFKTKMVDIQTFEDCVEAGYGILESDPPKCRTPDNRFFTADSGTGGEIINNECGVESCHGLEISCGPNIPDACTLQYAFGDRCRQYVSCQIIDGECRPVVGKKFDQCKSCVEKCLKDFKNDTVKQFECESKCE